MVLVDTSVWIHHLRVGDGALARLLERTLVLTHPFVVGELACGRLAQRRVVLGLLDALPAAPVAREQETRAFLEVHTLMGRGIGYVDVHLLASAALAGARLWTRDARLAAAAQALGLGTSGGAGSPE
jgi:predicted nucleic acid-binding protein